MSTPTTAITSTSPSPTRVIYFNPEDYVSQDPDIRFWTFFVYCLVIVIVMLFFLFYFNRLLGFVISKIVSYWTWKLYSAHIEIESIKFALLGGRISFRNLRYYSRNQSIYILQGHITFRYWTLKVREESDSKEHPCRVALRVKGIEWIIYNRTPIYNWVEEALQRHNQNEAGAALSEDMIQQVNVDLGNESERSMSSNDDDLFKKLLPIEFVSGKGSIMLGNPDVPSIVIIDWARAEGSYAAVQARSAHDRYKTVLSIKYQSPKLQVRANVDYKEPLSNTQVFNFRSQPNIGRRNPFNYIRHLMNRSKSSGYTPDNAFYLQHSNQWHGLARYRNNDEEVESAEPAGASEEYGRVTNVIECQELSLTYYVDVVGRVDRVGVKNGGHFDGDVGNGDLDPEWGVDLVFKNTVLNYGPWTDRQRFCIQQFFFPPLNRSLDVTPTLSPGDFRLHTALKFLIRFEGSSTWRIPLREFSKDGKFNTPSAATSPADGNPNLASNKYKRPYGWVDVKFKSGSTVSINIPMINTRSGYVNNIALKFDNVSISSSVNYSQLLEATQVQVNFKLRTPLVWNAERTWTIEPVFHSPKLTILRDHITLVQDLVSDWTFGPSTDFAFFIPIVYEYKFSFKDIQVWLCCNERNVIDQPNDPSDNVFLIWKSPKWELAANTPFLKYNESRTKIAYSLDAGRTVCHLSLPGSNTVGSFFKVEERDLISMNYLQFKGSYEYNNIIDGVSLDSMSMNGKISGVNITLWGFLMKHLFFLVDNYAGVSTNFTTLDEYRRRRNEGISVGKTNSLHNIPFNPFEFHLNLTMEDGAFILPENLYTCQNFSTIKYREMQIESRGIHIYQDICIACSPLVWSRSSLTQTGRYSHLPARKIENESANTLYLSSFTFHGHRMFGPPPDSSVYLSNYSFHMASITGNMEPSFILGLNSFVESFNFHYYDLDNMLCEPPLIDLDVLLASLDIGSIDIAIKTENSVTKVLFEEGVSIGYDNLVKGGYTSKLALEAPKFLVKQLTLAHDILDEAWDKFKNSDSSWFEVANISTGCQLLTYRRLENWTQIELDQLEFIRKNDFPTLRLASFYMDRISPTEAAEIRRKQGSWNYPNHPNGFFAPSAEIMRPDLDDEISMSVSDISRSEDGRHGFGQTLSASKSQNFDSTNDLFSIITSESDRSPYPFLSASDLADIAGSSTDLENNIPLSSHSLELSHGQSSTDSEFPPPVKVKPYPVQSSVTASDGKIESIPYRRYLKRYHLVPRQHLSQGHLYSSIKPVVVTFVEVSDAQSRYADMNPKASTTTGAESVFSGSSLDDTDGGNTLEGPRTNDNVAAMVFDSTSPLRLFLTPVILKHVLEIMRAADGGDVDLESILDEAYLSYFRKITRSYSPTFSKSMALVSIPKMELHTIQDVMLPDDLTTSNDEQPGLRTRYDLSDSVLCSAQVIMDRLLVKLSMTYLSPNSLNPNALRTDSDLITDMRIIASFDRLGANARFLGSMNAIGIFGIPKSRCQFDDEEKENIISNAYFNEPVVFDSVIKDFQVTMAQNQHDEDLAVLDFGLSECSSILINQTFEILAGATYTWFGFLRDLQKIFTEFSDVRSKQIQLLISEIGQQSSASLQNSDPIFLSQPSNLWRAGVRPFQNDVGWKLLGHVRHCLRSIPTNDASLIKEKINTESMLDMPSEALFKRTVEGFGSWRQWEIGDIRDCIFLSDLFQERKDSPNAFGNTGQEINSERFSFLSAVFKAKGTRSAIRIGKVSVCIFEQEDEENSFLCGPLNIDTVAAYKPQPDIKSSSLDGSRQSVKYLDVTVCFDLQRVDVTLDPNFLALLKHVLLVYRVFQSKVADLSDDHSMGDLSKMKSPPEIASRKPIAGSTEISGNGRCDVMVHLVAAVETVHIAAFAHNLMMKMQLDGFRVSFIDYAGGLRPGIAKNLHLSSSGGRESNVAGISGSSRRGDSLESLLNSVDATVECIGIYMLERGLDMGYNSLVSTDVHNISLDAVTRTKFKGKKSKKIADSEEFLDVFMNIEMVSVVLPQSLIKLYTFVDEWSSENLPSYGFLYSKILDEWDRQNLHSSSAFSSTPVANSRTSQFNLSVTDILFQSDILPSLNVQYQFYDVMTVFSRSEYDTIHQRFSNIGYSCQFDKQELRFITKQQNKVLHESPTSQATLQQIATFSIPTIRTFGTYKQSWTGSSHSSSFDSFVSFDVITSTLTVAMIDQLLTAQSVLSSEINDLLELFLFTRHHKQFQQASESDNLKESSNGNPFTIKLSVEGLVLAVISPYSVLLLESEMIEGLMKSNDTPGEAMKWKMSAHSTSLSVSHNIADPSSKLLENWLDSKSRLAYILLDIDIQNFSPRRGPVSSKLSELFINIHKLQCVAQPAAIGAIVDFWVYYARELRRRSHLKATELTKLADNTKLILDSLNVELPKKKVATNILEHVVISFQLNNLGIAIPLTMSESSVAMPESLPRLPDSMPSKSPAFLLTIRTFDITSERGKISEGAVKDLVIQFVPLFDQNVEKNFYASYHSRCNRFGLMNIESRVLIESSVSRQSLNVEAKVNGFEMEIDGSIASYIGKLMDVWETSKSRFGDIAPDEPYASKAEIVKEDESSAESEALEFCVEAVFEFDSGQCRFVPQYRDSHKRQGRKSSRRTLFSSIKPSFIQVGLDAPGDARQQQEQIEFVIFPAFSVRSSAQLLLGSTKPQRILFEQRAHFEMYIHPSENIIHPSLIPFVIEVLEGLKDALSMRDPKADEISADQSSDAFSPVAVSNVGTKITVAVKIDRSRLELRCHPGTKVASVLELYSADFLLISGAQINGCDIISVIGSISNVTTVLQHAFSPEECLKIGIRDVSLNGSLIRSPKTTKLSLLLSVPEVQGAFNIRHLQDFFVFQEAWFFGAREPEHSSLNVDSGHLEQLVSSSSETGSTRFQFDVAVQLPNVTLSADLSQGIGKVTCKVLDCSCSLTALPAQLQDLLVLIGAVELRSEGRVFGGFSVKGIRTIVRSSAPITNLEAVRAATTAETSADLVVANVQHQYDTILVARMIGPRMALSSGWNDLSIDSPVLTIDVKGQIRDGTILVGLKTIPTVFTLMKKLSGLVEEKRLRSYVESETPARTKSPNPVREQDLVINDIPISVAGSATILLGHTRIAFFHDYFHNTDCIQLTLERFFLHLSRSVDNDSSVITRNLNSHFAQLMLLKSTSEKKLPLSDAQKFNVDNWIEHVSNAASKSIVLCPATDLAMQSLHSTIEKTVDYTFLTDFDGAIDMAYNWNVYKYMKDLVGLYAEEITRATQYNITIPLKTSFPIATQSMPPLASKSIPSSPLFDQSNKQLANTSELTPLDILSTSKSPNNVAGSSPQSDRSDLSIKFKAISPPQIEPRLKMMGEATPSLDWIGISKDKIPELVHLYGTLKVETVISSALRVYKQIGILPEAWNTVNSDHDRSESELGKALSHDIRHSTTKDIPKEGGEGQEDDEVTRKTDTSFLTADGLEGLTDEKLEGEDSLVSLTSEESEGEVSGSLDKL